MKITVLQVGSRHRYAIPRIINKAGYLELFVTDSSSHSPLGNVAKLLQINYPKIKRLTSRVVEDVPSQKIKSSDSAFLKQSALTKNLTPFQELQQHLKISNILSSYAKKVSADPPEIIYSMNREFQEYVKYAKSKKTKVVTDIFINPLTSTILSELPGIESSYPQDFIELDIKTYKRTFEIADVLTCPSNWVAQGILSISPEVESKIHVIPYGSSISPNQDYNNKPEIGRILFVGRDLIRKGIRNLNKAIEDIIKEFPSVVVRIAGASRSDIESLGINNQSIIPLGNLNREALTSEYQKCDALILPSYSEGFASVIAEATAFGIPLIVSQACGFEFQHGGAIIIDPYDFTSIKNSIYSLVTDRGLRNKLAKSNKEISKYYTEEAWSIRLLQTFQKI